MYKIIYSEILKLKNAKILLLIPISAIIPVFLIFLNSYDDSIYRASGWAYFLGHVILTMSELTPPVFILFTGFIFSREYHDNTIECMFTYPISRTSILVGKMLVMILVVFAVMFLSLVFALFLGNFLLNHSLTWKILIMYVKIFFFISIMHLTLVPAAATVSIVSKNIIASAVASVASLLLLVAFLNSKLNVFFPWCVPTLLATKWGKYIDFWQLNTSHAFITLSIALIIPLVFNIIYFRKINLTT